MKLTIVTQWSKFETQGSILSSQHLSLLLNRFRQEGSLFTLQVSDSKLIFLGIIYCFIGIALITQNYINPAIDIIKKKGIVSHLLLICFQLSSDMMNATLLAFSNSAAESFIVLNSILFGVSDIGIQTAVQQSAFSALIIMGIFYRLAPEDTRIDWWISTRDSLLFIVYLCVQSYFLFGNKIETYAIYVLLVIYMIHVILMKLNHPVEVMIKKSVANYFEVRELHRLADENIQHFHHNLDGRSPCLELLNKIKFKQEGARQQNGT